MTDHRPTDPDDVADARHERADDETGHTSDQASLAERDRPQENLATQQANLRADDDDGPEERSAALDEVRGDRTD